MGKTTYNNELNRHLIFVYGTLKSGYNNNRLLARGDAQCLGAAVTFPEFRLMAYEGGIPFMFSHKPGNGIKGELWLVNDDCLASLDRLEGHPHNYRRTHIQVMQDNQPVQCETYLYHHQRPGMIEIGCEWPPKP